MIRLINVHTLCLTSFDDGSVPAYAIASHRWLGDSEISYEDFTERRRTDSHGHAKVVAFCAFVHKASVSMSVMLGCVLDWVWIDTCCIKKSDSSELSEAINSMFDWYARAKVCFAYMSDVRPGGDQYALLLSAWFDRGWTLQELLAPSLVVFLDAAWAVRGHKKDAAFGAVVNVSQSVVLATIGPDLNGTIALRAGIQLAVLQDLNHIHCISIEEILGWMNGRYTSRREDQAYCLLGVLDVSMPLVYGEREYAMIRLLEQVQLQFERQLRNLGDQECTKAGKPGRLLRADVSLLNKRMVQLHEERYHRRAQDRRPTVATLLRTEASIPDAGLTASMRPWSNVIVQHPGQAQRDYLDDLDYAVDFGMSLHCADFMASDIEQGQTLGHDEESGHHSRILPADGEDRSSNSRAGSYSEQRLMSRIQVHGNRVPALELDDQLASSFDGSIPFWNPLMSRWDEEDDPKQESAD